MDFGKVLTRAWEIIWKHKVLWLFGILASCGSQRGNFDFGGTTSYQFEGNEIPYLPLEYQRFFWEMQRFFEENAEKIIAAGIALVVLGIFIAILFFVMSHLGRLGLIQGTLRAEKGVETLTFGEIFEEMKPFIWRVLGLNFLITIMFLGLTLILVFVVVGGAVFTIGLGLICLIPLICLLVPIGWYLSIVIKQANITLVAEDLTIFEAIERGWNFAFENLANMIVMGLILMVGGLGISFIIGLPQIFTSVPFFVGVITGDIFSDPEAFFRGFGATVVLQLLYLPIFLVLRGVLNSYIESAWVLTYLENKDEEGLNVEETPQLSEPSGVQPA